MRIQLLRTFLVCADLRNFLLAAERLVYSESTIGYQIRVLEKSLGAQLFTRANSHRELTTAGRAILRPSIELLR